VWRISPLGVELLLGDNPPAIDRGSRINLVLQMGRQQSQFQGLVVETRHSEGKNDLIGIRWYPEQGETPFIGNRRAKERYMCGVQFLPTGVAPNPVRFNDFIHFRVRDVSADGMQIVSSLRNKFLVPGMELDSMVSFPTIGQIRARLRIIHARIHSEDGRDYLSLGTRLTNPNPRITQILGQYVMQFGPPASVEALRDAGLHLTSAVRAVEFGFVRTEEEYRQVLELRRLAYTSAGKISKQTTAEETSDIYDTRARILVARYKGEIIASLRLIYHEPGDRTEHEQFTTLPDDFPRKDELVEITRVCTHPDYRRSDLLLGLFKHAVLAVLQSGRRWILGSATPKLLHVYTRLGCRATAVKYRHEDLGSEEHNIFLGDTVAGLSGAAVGPIVWNLLFDDMWDHLDTRNLLPRDPVVALRLAMYRGAKPFASLALRRMQKPRKRKKTSS
jgi:predicted GNAT family N-acyltransferase